MNFTMLLAQAAISVVAVAVYHLWVTRRKPAAPVTPVVPAPVPAVRPAKLAPAEEAMPPEILAIIAAAIATVLDGPHRIISVQQGAPQATEINVWALEGRMQQFMSHKVR